MEFSQCAQRDDCKAEYYPRSRPLAPCRRAPLKKPSLLKRFRYPASTKKQRGWYTRCLSNPPVITA
jgi:hypothetical protein